MSLFFHADDPIVIPTLDGGTPTSVLEGFGIGEYVGNPLYTVIPEHVLASILLVLAPIVIWLTVKLVRTFAARGGRRATAVVDAFRSASIPRRIAAVALWYSALIHGVLVLTHEPSGYSVLYIAGAALLSFAGWWTVRSVRGKLSAAILIGSIATFWILGAPADQLGMATKLLELFALGLVSLAGTEGATRLRRLAPAGVVALVVLTGVSAWIGAFATVGADGGHHGGEYPDPGTLVPYIDRLEPTAEELHYAADLHADLVLAMDKYRDPAVAEQAGYNVGTVIGSDHHAQNKSLIGDGRILDPEYPESLIYAKTLSGPVLVGVMFEMDGFTDKGPTDGGPIMLWHAHENVCFGLTPPLLAGLESPFGMCPVGSFNIPRTGEMLHAWILPDVPFDEQWGHIDEDWLADYLLEHSQQLVAGAAAMQP